MKKTLYDAVLAVVNKEKVDLKKAATDYEIGGTLTPTDALSLFDTVIATSNLIARIRRVLAESNTVNLNQFVNKGVLAGRSNAATAKAAVLAGNSVAGITKDNIGNTATLKELYYLHSFLPTELSNFARLGRGVFQRESINQLAEGWKEILEEQVLIGDNTANQAYGFIPNAKANLAASPAEEATGKKVRNIDTDGFTTVTEALQAIYNKQQLKYRSKSVIMLNTADFDTYCDEIIAGTSLQTGRDILRDTSTLQKFKGIELIPLDDMPSGNYLMCPLDNMAFVINNNNVVTNVDVENVPKSWLYSIFGEWNFQFVTFDKVVIAYDQTP